MANENGTVADQLPDAVKAVLGENGKAAVKKDAKKAQKPADNGSGKAAPEVVASAPPEVQPVVSAGIEVPGVETTLVEIPLGPTESRFPNPRIDIRLSGDSVNHMHRFFTGLKASKQRLQNDMPIRSNGDAIRWLLEQIGASIPALPFASLKQ